MKKIKLFAFTLIAFCLFGVTRVKAYTDAEFVKWNQLIYTGNISGVTFSETGPSNASEFTIENVTYIQGIRNYHYTGSRPVGTIGLLNVATNKMVGTWDGTLSFSNYWWSVYPEIVLKPGTYRVIDSNPATWAFNYGSNYRGFTDVRGYYFAKIEGEGDVSLDKYNANSGEIVTITTTPADNYRLKEIKILNVSDDSDVTGLVNYNTTNKTFMMPDYNVMVYVKFEKICTVTFDTIAGITYNKTSPIIVKSGDNEEIIVTADLGYRLTSIKVNGVEQLPLTDNKVTLTNIEENKEIVVTVEKIPFTITINEVTGATITPNGTVNALYGDDKEITVTADLGYRLTSVKVNGVEQLPLTNNKVTLTDILENKEIVVTVEKIEYDVTNGDGQKHIIGKNEDAIFRIDADKDLFLKASLNGEELNPEFYTITEGSTIITLKQEFLNNLLPGTYDLKAIFSDGGEANTTFVIAKPAEINPKTGDSIMLSIILGCISLIGLLGAGLYFKKENA